MSDKKKPIFGLDKLPNQGYIKGLENLLKEYRVNKGKDQAYIHELEDTLANLRKLTDEQLKEKNTDELVRGYKKEIKDLKKQIIKYNKDTKNLINKNLTLKRQIENGKTKDDHTS